MHKNWQRVPAPNSVGAKVHGWLREMNEAYRATDGRYAVLVRTLETGQLGSVKHAAIRNAESTEISWSEKQRIKNELFGEEKQAIEFFPKQSELIDEANMYHIWVFVEKELTFGIGPKLGEGQQK